MKFTAIYHYAEWDTEFDGDYYSIELWHENERICWYGDFEYSGDEKLHAFIDGVKYITGEEVNLAVIRKADGVTR